MWAATACCATGDAPPECGPTARTAPTAPQTCLRGARLGVWCGSWVVFSGTVLLYVRHRGSVATCHVGCGHFLRVVANSE